MSDRKENAKTPAGAPVMKAASSLVRNDTVPTRSAGTSGRLIACMEAAWRYSSSMLAMPARGARALIVLAATMWAAPPNAANDTAVPIPTDRFQTSANRTSYRRILVTEGIRRQRFEHSST